MERRQGVLEKPVMWTWLFPYFIPIVCVLGPQGMLAPGIVGPIENEQDVQIMQMYLRYESGCETGETVRKWRWLTAIPAEPLYPNYWVNLHVVGDAVPHEQFAEHSKLKWRTP